MCSIQVLSINPPVFCVGFLKLYKWMVCFQSCFHNHLCSWWCFPSKIHPLKWGVLAKQAFICGPWWSVTESLSDVFVFFFPNFDGKKDATKDDGSDGHFLIPCTNDDNMMLKWMFLIGSREDVKTMRGCIQLPPRKLKKKETVLQVPAIFRFKNFLVFSGVCHYW